MVFTARGSRTRWQTCDNVFRVWPVFGGSVLACRNYRTCANITPKSISARPCAANPEERPDTSLPKVSGTVSCSGSCRNHASLITDLRSTKGRRKPAANMPGSTCSCKQHPDAIRTVMLECWGQDSTISNAFPWGFLI